MQENFGETMRQLSATWRSLSQHEKDHYRDAAAKQLAANASARGRSNTGKTTAGSRQRSRSTKDSRVRSRSRRPAATSVNMIMRNINK